MALILVYYSTKGKGGRLGHVQFILHPCHIECRVAASNKYIDSIDEKRMLEEKTRMIHTHTIQSTPLQPCPAQPFPTQPNAFSIIL